MMGIMQSYFSQQKIQTPNETSTQITSAKYDKQRTQSFAILSSSLFNYRKKLQILFSTILPLQKNILSVQHIQSSQPQQKDFKLQQLKQLFETRMNKYNLKGLMKMYQILRHNSVQLSEQSLKEFDYRLIQELNSMDHHSTNAILQLSYRNGQAYQSLGKNKLLRGINLKLQKGRLQLEPSQVYRTVTLLMEMRFPKSTLSKVLFRLVIQSQANKRILYHLDNLNALKISLIALQNVEVDLQTKKRVLENLLLIKPKGVIELAYFYCVLKMVTARMEDTVRYQAQKRTVYDLAFNPYSMYGEDGENIEETNKSGNNQNHQQDNNDNNAQNDKISKQQNHQNHPIKDSKASSQKPHINQTILKNLLQQKQKILEQTFQKLNLQKVSEQIYQQLNELITDPENNELQFKEMRRVAVLLATNSFGDETVKNRKVIVEVVSKILSEGLISVKSSQAIDLSKFIRVSQFVIFLQQLVDSEEKSQLSIYLTKYQEIYYNLMNLQQKLIFHYHKSITLNEPIPLQKIKQEITKIDYGLNSEEFIWLNKVLELGQQKQSGSERQVVRDIWRHVEASLDEEISTLVKDKQEEESNKERRKQQQGNEDNSKKQENSNKDKR